MNMWLSGSGVLHLRGSEPGGEWILDQEHLGRSILVSMYGIRKRGHEQESAVVR